MNQSATRKLLGSRLIKLGFFAVAITAMFALGRMTVTAIQMVLSGKGTETYQTPWLVEFNWIGFLVFEGALVVALVIGAWSSLRQNRQWRELQQKYPEEK